MNGAGSAHGKEANEDVWGRRAGCMVRGGKRGCSSGLSNTVRHSELPEHLCSGQLDSLLSEDLVVCQCGRSGSCRAHGGKRGVRARRLGGLRCKWRQLRLQPRRGHRRLRRRRQHWRQRCGRWRWWLGREQQHGER